MLHWKGLSITFFQIRDQGSHEKGDLNETTNLLLTCKRQVIYPYFYMLSLVSLKLILPHACESNKCHHFALNSTCNSELLLCVYIASSQHLGWVGGGLGELLKVIQKMPLNASWVCMPVSDSPNPLFPSCLDYVNMEKVLYCLNVRWVRMYIYVVVKN